MAKPVKGITSPVVSIYPFPPRLHASALEGIYDILGRNRLTTAVVSLVISPPDGQASRWKFSARPCVPSCHHTLGALAPGNQPTATLPITLAAYRSTRDGDTRTRYAASPAPITPAAESRCSTRPISLGLDFLVLSLLECELDSWCSLILSLPVSPRAIVTRRRSWYHPNFAV
ncbi:hypothetical protein CGRA01v4_09242 [Colletotrichum graminicola]|nr:hypothetical protein CGRA01v4_09242 [Colletotrichum graminicola]